MKIKNLLILSMFLANLHASISLFGAHTNVVFVKEANIRAQPSTDSKIIGKLSHGSEVEECYTENGRSEDIIGGVASYWKPIQYNNGIGYVWEGVMADIFIGNIEKGAFMMKHNTQKNKLETKFFSNGKFSHETTLDAPKLKKITSAVFLGVTYHSKGKNVIAITFTEPDYGYLDSYLLFTWDGKSLVKFDEKLNDESILGKYHAFEKGIVNANNVNLKEFPDSKSKVLVSLNKYTYVDIDSACFKQDSILNGIATYWHKITYKGMVGYVYSDFLDIPNRYIKSNINEKESFLYTNLSIYALEGDKIIGRHIFDAPHYYKYDKPSFLNQGTKGLNPSYRFLAFHRSPGYCGGWIGDELYLWDGKKFSFFGMDGGSGEFGYYHEYNSLIFPNQKGGIPGKVISHETTYEDVDFMPNNRCDYYFDLLLHESVVVNEFNGDTLLEVPSTHYYLRKYFAAQYPKHELMHYQFTDLNNDGIEDVVFYLYSRFHDNYDPNLTPIVGIVYGDGKNAFKELTISKSIIKKDITGVHISIEKNKIEFHAFYLHSNSESDRFKRKVEQYMFHLDTIDNSYYWHSKTTYQDNNTQNEHYQKNDLWEVEESQNFKTKKILFENAW